MRIDQYLVVRKLAPSRTKAQELIRAGHVEIKKGEQWALITSSSQKVTEITEVRLSDSSSVLKYVSRGGLKLEGALEDFQVQVNDLKCLDVGQSTGGFTDCLLQLGAKEVLGVDVGHGQLHTSLLNDSRVQSFEGIHISDLLSQPAIEAWVSKGFDLCVIDVSFISAVKVFEALKEFSQKNFLTLALIKPQFEVGRDQLNKAGVVKTENATENALREVKEKIESFGFKVLEDAPCRIRGADGNQEFFFKVAFEK